jgi:hypothetical protein
MAQKTVTLTVCDGCGEVVHKGQSQQSVTTAGMGIGVNELIYHSGCLAQAFQYLLQYTGENDRRNWIMTQHKRIGADPLPGQTVLPSGDSDQVNLPWNYEGLRRMMEERG